MKVTKLRNTIKVMADEGKMITEFKSGDNICDYVAYNWVVGQDLDYTRFTEISMEQHLEYEAKRNELLEQEVEEVIL